MLVCGTTIPWAEGPFISVLQTMYMLPQSSTQDSYRIQLILQHWCGDTRKQGNLYVGWWTSGGKSVKRIHHFHWDLQQLALTIMILMSKMSCTQRRITRFWRCSSGIILGLHGILCILLFSCRVDCPYRGTCAMKPRDSGGVVDKNLNVYGTKNVKVAGIIL